MNTICRPFLIALVVATTLCSGATVSQPIGIQVDHVLSVSPDNLPPAYRSLISENVLIHKMSITTSDPNLELTQKGDKWVDVRPRSKGAHPAVVSVDLEVGGQRRLHNINVNFTGYEVDRTGVYSPRPEEYANPNEISFDTPRTLTATIRMKPYVPHVEWEFSFFAHTTTFIGGQRKFTAVTGAPSTSIGERGWRTEVDTGTGETVGVLDFKMIIPGTEQSWCIRTNQTPFLPAEPTQSMLIYTINN